MRNFTIVSLVMLGFVAALVAQEQQWDRSQWGRSPDRTPSDRSTDRPPWERSSDRSDGRPSRSSDGRQPPWGNGPPPSMQRRGFPQGPPSDRGGSSDRTSRMMGMFRAMDANRNGVLEPTEISETRRGFVSAIATRMGADPSRPINLADLERRAAAANNSPSRSNDNSRSNRLESDRSRSPSATATEPLVPPFGEQKPAEKPALAFGQREVVVAAAVNASASAVIPNQSVQAAPQAVRQSTPYDNISAEVRENTSLDWFFAYDKDADGQLTMQEYVGGYGGTWTPAIASEFRFLDRNGDGFSTLDEVLLTLKEVDEQRAATTTNESEQNRPMPGPPGSLQPQPKPIPPSSQPQPSTATGTSPPKIVPVSAAGGTINQGGNGSSRSRRGNYSRSGR